jgi:hypothetical protein
LECDDVSSLSFIEAVCQAYLMKMAAEKENRIERESGDKSPHSKVLQPPRDATIEVRPGC